jgi:ribosomal protein S6--L-glutamate ligase
MAITATRLLGLDYAGVDLVEGPAGPVVLEVNGTPLFRGILEATGLDMAESIVEHAISRVGRRKRGKRAARVEGRRTQSEANTARWALRRGA